MKTYNIIKMFVDQMIFANDMIKNVAIEANEQAFSEINGEISLTSGGSSHLNDVLINYRRHLQNMISVKKILIETKLSNHYSI